MNRIGAFIMSVFCCSILGACGGGSSSAVSGNPPATVLGDTVLKTISATGGTVEAVSSGVKVSLIFPVGALVADTVVKVTPQTPAAGDFFSVKLEPGDTIFKQPVTVVLEYPADKVISAKTKLRMQLGGSDTYIATVVDTTAHTLTAKFTSFGGTALDVLSKPPVARAAWSQALLAKILAIPTAPASGVISASANTSVTEMIASVRRQVTIMENVGDFDGAFALQAGIASLLQYRGDVDYPTSVLPFLREAHATACLALSTAIADSRKPLVTADEFKSVRERMANWWIISGDTSVDGTSCPGATIEVLTQAGLDLMTREQTFLKAKFKKVAKAIDFSEPAAEVKAARRNKLEVEALESAERALNLPPLPEMPTSKVAAKTTRLAATTSGFAALIQTELLDPTITPAREAAWITAKTEGSLGQYPVLLDSFGSAPVLQQDVQFVRTRINARVNDSSGSALASSTLGFEVVPDLPADPKRSDTLTLTKGRTLALSGNIATLDCDNAGEETLKVTFEGVQVASVTGSGGTLLAGALGSFTRAALLSAAGLPADDTGNHSLHLRRSSPCTATLGLTDDLLGSLTLSLSEKQILFEAFSNPVGDLYSVSPDGSGLTRLGFGVSPSYIQWLSNYTKILFRGTINNGVFTYWSINPDGSGLTQIQLPLRVDDTNPTWSPDGRRVAFYQNNISTFNNPICIWNTDGSGQNCFQPDGLGYWGADGPSWSPDGTRITFSFISSDPTTAGQNIYVMNVDGSGVAKLTNYHYPDSFPQASYPAWSPDGSKIALSISNNNDSYGLKGSNIFVMNTDGTGLVQLTTDNLSQGPVWSPDGTQIAYTYGLGYGFSRNYIRVMKADGTGQVQVAQGWLPSWR